MITWNFGKVVNQVSSYIENEIAEIHFAEDTLMIKSKDENAGAIIVEDTELLNGKIIIDTGDLNEEQVTKYEEAVKDIAMVLLF